MIKYVIFDMDGTLIDTEPAYERSWVEVGKLRGLDGMKEMYPSIIGKSISSIILMMKEKFGEDFDGQGFFEERMQYFTSLIEKELKTLPGCFELLGYLREKNIPMALATSTPMYITDRNMRRTGIDKYMSAVVTAEMVKNGKPAPDIFIEAGNRIGAEPEFTLVCEDSPYGIRAAYDAKMKPVFIKGDISVPTEETFREAYAVVDSLADIIEIIKKENKEK